MDKYKFVYFKANSDEIISFVELNTKDINNIMESCFNINFTGNDNWIIHNDAFFITYNQKVVALAITSEQLVTRYDVEMEKYRLVSFDNFDKVKRKVLVDPMISSLCRDSNPKYKGTGKLLLMKICEYYKNNDYKQIFIIPESSKFKVYGANDCGTVLEKEEYLKSQESLQKYYGKFGFQIKKHHYDVDNCNDNESFNGPYVMFPVYYKKLC
jgi:hypothetical protein